MLRLSEVALIERLLNKKQKEFGSLVMSETLEIYRKLRESMSHKEAVKRLEDMGGELDAKTRDAIQEEREWTLIEKKLQHKS